MLGIGAGQLFHRSVLLQGSVTTFGIFFVIWLINTNGSIKSHLESLQNERAYCLAIRREACRLGSALKKRLSEFQGDLAGGTNA